MNADQVVAENARATHPMALRFHRIDHRQADLLQLRRLFSQAATGEGGFENRSAEFFNRIGKCHSHLSSDPRSRAASTIWRASGAANCAPYPPCSTTTANA